MNTRLRRRLAAVAGALADTLHWLADHARQLEHQLLGAAQESRHG